MTINEVPRATHIPRGYKRWWRNKYCFCINFLKLDSKKAREWADRSTQVHIKVDSENSTSKVPNAT